MVKLYGDIIEGDEFMSFDFTNDDFSNYFGNEEDFKVVVAKGLKPFDINSEIIPTKKNPNIIVISNSDLICYSHNEANGPHPERYQSRDDYTDWLKTDVGINDLSDILKIIEKLK